MRIQVPVDDVICDVEFRADGSVHYVASLTKGRVGAMDSSRTIWPRKRNKPMTDLARRAIDAATEKRASPNYRMTDGHQRPF